MTSRALGNFDQGNKAAVYVGNTLCGTLPATLEASKVYNFNCVTSGDFVKIVTGRTDGFLTFANVNVYESNNMYEWEPEFKEGMQITQISNMISKSECVLTDKEPIIYTKSDIAQNPIYAPLNKI